MRRGANCGSTTIIRVGRYLVRMGSLRIFPRPQQAGIETINKLKGRRRKVRKRA
jgi:hypothetical protein